MNFFGKGRKGRKGEPQQAEPPAIDFSAPDAFSEENMAKVSNAASQSLGCTAVCTAGFTTHAVRSIMECTHWHWLLIYVSVLWPHGLSFLFYWVPANLGHFILEVT